jgi:predicted nucleic acid-binding protein
MAIFIDTSAFLAVLDADEINHAAAKTLWQQLVSQEAVLVCTNYVIVETFALAQRRLGLDAVRTFQEDILPVVAIHWVDPTAHAESVASLLIAARRDLSLVDCVSFNVMRATGLEAAFAFDRHFQDQGFSLIP